MMGLPDGPKSFFKIGLVVNNTGCDRQPASHPPCHVAVANRLYATRRAQKAGQKIKVVNAKSTRMQLH